MVSGSSIPPPVSSHWSVAAPAPLWPLIGQQQVHPALCDLSLLSGCSVTLPVASHWSAAAPSRSRLPLICQWQLQPAPGGLSLLSGCSIPPPVASHWSVAAPAPLRPLIGQQQLRPAPGCLSLVSGSSGPPPASPWSTAFPALPRPLIGQRQRCLLRLAEAQHAGAAMSRIVPGWRPGGPKLQRCRSGPTACHFFRKRRPFAEPCSLCARHQSQKHSALPWETQPSPQRCSPSQHARGQALFPAALCTCFADSLFVGSAKDRCIAASLHGSIR